MGQQGREAMLVRRKTQTLPGNQKKIWVALFNDGQSKSPQRPQKGVQATGVSPLAALLWGSMWLPLLAKQGQGARELDGWLTAVVGPGWPAHPHPSACLGLAQA